MKPLVSVIVPVYGTEAYLEQCADSILQQTWQNLEIILVDDGSPDRCPEICDAYAEKDPRVRVIHRRSAGVSAARNAGLDAAGGEYISFVDSDDWILPDMIETLVTACEYDHTDLAFCRMIYVKQGKVYQPAPEPAEVISAEDLLRDILMHRRGSVSSCNKLYKAKLFDGIRFPEGVRFEEDPVFFLLIRKANGVSYTGTASYFYRFHSGSFCNSSFIYDKVRWKREHLKTLESQLREQAPQLLPLLKYHAAYTEFEMLRSYLQCGGEIAAEEERSMRESFEKSFPDLLEMLQGRKDRQDRREAVWIRLGLWDSIRTAREKADEIEKQLPEKTRQEIDLEHDVFTQRILRAEEYVNIEKELKRSGTLLKNTEKLQKENEALRAQVQDLSTSRSYRIGRAITRVPGLFRKIIRRS